MRFVDSNVFIYAYFVPMRALTPTQKELKEKSKKIIQRIDEGEHVATSVINLSEIANVLKTCFSLSDLSEFFEALLSKENVKIYDVNKNDWLSAGIISRTYSVRFNDCVIAHLMKTNHVKEIYSFDEDFKKFPWVIKLSR